jgi:hypothetical protein
MLEPTGIKRNVQLHSYTLISKKNIGGLISGDPSYHGCPSDLRTHGRGDVTGHLKTSHERSN